MRATLPDRLAALQTLAMNVRWSWDARTRSLFRWIDPELWDETGHDPIGLLGRVGRERLDALADDPSFMSFLDEISHDLDRYLGAQRWFQKQEMTDLHGIAYFSPEFGIAEALPQYSGGLGVLAGDHLKAASGLGVPLVGVGLFYREGYFRQALNNDGWQQERYPKLDPHSMAITPLDTKPITIDLAGTTIYANVWRVDVGRIRLYLLDTDRDDNDFDARTITDRLYGGGSEHRIRQEILLGMGGVRALGALGENIQVFHTNEGHAGFLGLERIRQLVTGHGLSFSEAVEAVRAGTLFTTHTPVAAGIDRFDRSLIEKYFSGWCQEVGVSIDQLMQLGHVDGDTKDAPFNMAVMGFRLSSRANGVSKLHGAVSRSMFANVWPGVPVDEVPIGHVTNGVHGRTWVSPEQDELFSRYVVPDWHEASVADWDRIDDARDDEIWRVRRQGREQLVEMVRKRSRNLARANGVPDSDLGWTDELLDANTLTIGFARRFAPYKRASLLLSQPARLLELIGSTDRPVQFVFAGKAHPADDPGKDLIRQIVAFSRRPETRGRFVFVEDYDIAVARTMYQGCDVWLNNPRRPLEACGTSGEKAALSGALNLSVLDGWWDEMYDGENGWAIPSAETYTDLSRRDQVEAESLFDLFERQVVPLFYDRTEGPLPRKWIRRVRHSLKTLVPLVSASRMVRDYANDFYGPLATSSKALNANDFEGAKILASWKDQVRQAWPRVRVVNVESDLSLADLGTLRTVDVQIDTGSLLVDDVTVQLLHGTVGASDELNDVEIAEMKATGSADNLTTFHAKFECDATGRYGFAVRVLPKHKDLAQPLEMSCIAWG